MKTSVRRLARIGIGALVWTAAVLALGLGLGRSSGGAEGGSIASRLYRHVIEGPTRVRVRFPAGAFVPVGTRVVVRDGESFRAVGEVASENVNPNATVDTVAELAPEIGDSVGPRSRAILLTAPGTAAWIVKTLLPNSTRNRIHVEIEKLVAANWQDSVAAFKPLIAETLHEAYDVLARDFRQTVERHRGELEELVRKHQADTIEQDLIPLVRSEIWPRVVERCRPKLEEIGRELWDRLPLWGLTWNWVYGKLPATPDDSLERRFNRFLQDEAIPLLRSRQDEIVELLADVGQEVVDDPHVREVFRRSIEKIVTDPQFQRLTREMLNELVLENQDLPELLERKWRDERVQIEFRRLSARLQPGIDRIINDILLNETDDGINPALARVLRTEILQKDTVLILLEPARESPRQERSGELVLQGELGADD